MKKLLFSTIFTAALLSGLMGGGLKASEINNIIKNTGWTWECQDVNILNKSIEAVNNIKSADDNEEARKISVILRSKIQIALIGKNSTNTSYTEFKTIVDKIIADAGYKRTVKSGEKVNFKNPYLRGTINTLIPQSILRIKRFNQYILTLAKDPEFSFNHYRKCYILSAMRNENINEFRIEFKTTINNYKGASKYNAEKISNALILYKNRMTEIKRADILEDLQYVKMLTYSNIQKDDAWKNVMVTLELMMKSVQ